MTYFNNTDANFYPISDVPEELGCYPFVEQTPATEGVGMADNSIFPDWWTTAEQVVPVARSPTNFYTTANNCGECQFNLFVDRDLTREPPGPVASATSYATWGNSYGQPEYPVHDWPAAGQQVTYHHPGFSSWDVSLASVAVPETLAVAPTPGSGECRSYFETRRNLTSTNYEQFRSTTGGPTRASSLLAPPMWKVLEHSGHCATPLTPSHGKTYIRYIRSMLVRLGLRYCRLGGSSRMECPVPARTSTGTQQQDHRPWCSRPSHTLTD